VTDRANGAHHDAAFRDLPAFLRRGDLLVVNDSATIPAALEAHGGDGAPFRLHMSRASRPSCGSPSRGGG